MKKIVWLLTLFSVLNFAGLAQTKIHHAKRDTVMLKSKKKQVVAKGREARMRLQLKQIKQHKKQQKEVDSIQKELNRERHKPNQRDS